MNTVVCFFHNCPTVGHSTGWLCNSYTTSTKFDLCVCEYMQYILNRSNIIVCCIISSKQLIRPQIQRWDCFNGVCVPPIPSATQGKVSLMFAFRARQNTKPENSLSYDYKVLGVGVASNSKLWNLGKQGKYQPDFQSTCAHIRSLFIDFLMIVVSHFAPVTNQ